MANHKGSEGSVYIDSNKIAELIDWSLNETGDVVEDTIMGETSRTYQATLTSGSGSMRCFWDETDVDGQGAMDVGSSVTLNLYPEGNATGATYFTMTALITGRNLNAAFDGMVEALYDYQATGDIDGTTVT